METEISPDFPGSDFITTVAHYIAITFVSITYIELPSPTSQTGNTAIKGFNWDKISFRDMVPPGHVFISSPGKPRTFYRSPIRRTAVLPQPSTVCQRARLR